MQVNNAQQISVNNTQYQSKGSQSEHFADLIKTYQSEANLDVNKSTNSSLNYKMDTTQGSLDFDLDDFFTAKPSTQSYSLEDIPILLPTAHNVNTLSAYSEKQFKAMLEEYGIDSPPASIEFDQNGQLVLPADYTYSAELKQALNDNPSIEKALRTTTALASHYAGMMAVQPFNDEMMTARSQADRDRIIEKYSYLFDDNRPAKLVAIRFLEDGSLLLTEKTT